MSHRRLREESAAFALGFLTRAVLWFAVLGLIGHDVGQIVWAQVQVSDAAHQAAQAAADTYYKFKVKERAEQEALETVAAVNKGIDLMEFRIDVDGSVWTAADEEATTFIFGRVGFLKAWALRRATAHEERSFF